MNEIKRTVLTSMEVAEMVGKQHKDLLKDIRRYSAQLVEGKISPNNFFQESTYITENNRIAPCFMVTKKGCEFIRKERSSQHVTSTVSTRWKREMRLSMSRYRLERLPVT